MSSFFSMLLSVFERLYANTQQGGAQWAPVGPNRVNFLDFTLVEFNNLGNLGGNPAETSLHIR